MATPRQETGGRQSTELALPRQPQEMESGIPPAAKRLAELIATLLVALFNFPGGSFTIFGTTARTAVQYFFQISPASVEERDKVKHDGEEIKLRLKEIFHEGNKLEEKFRNFPYNSNVDLIKWEWDLSIARDRLAKCGIDIHILHGLVGRLISDLQAKVKWTILQVITGLLFASAVIGHWYYWAYITTYEMQTEFSMPVVWKGGLLILLSVFLTCKVRVYYGDVQILHEDNRVKRELEESRRCYMKCKVTLEETLPSLKEVVDKFDGGSHLQKMKSE